MPHDFNKFLQKQLKTKKAGLVLGVSGGVDSMVLVELLRKTSHSLYLVHINYKKRGEASDQDEALVRGYAEKHELPLFCFSYKPSGSGDQSAHFQMEARRFRYQRFWELLEQQKADYICTAHHADDQAETVLMRFLQGASLPAMAGMRILDGQLFRPLLPFSKSALYAYAKEKGVPFREDESNYSLDYERNHLRNMLLPQLETHYPGLRKALLRHAEHFQSLQEGLEHLVPDKAVWEEKEPGKVYEWNIQDMEMVQLSPQMVYAHVLRIVPGFTWKAALYLSKVLGQLSEAEGPTVMEHGDWLFYLLPECVRALHRTSREARVLREEEKPAAALPLDIRTKGSVFWEEKKVGIHWKKKVEEPTRKQLQNSQGVYLDAAKLGARSSTLMARLYHPGRGYYIRPLGMDGKKKLLSDVFTDQKVERLQRSRQVMIMADTADKEVLALLPLGIVSEKVKISAESRNFILFCFAENPKQLN